ncbi:PLP-dependent transferase [Thozetella sp. PMI_491]|nr:PLP-dependent transferase [Thozetella sp. PMI_491]
MPLPPITVEAGNALPPGGPHAITLHAPGWDLAMRFRDRDMSVFAIIKSIYPRFGPFGISKQFAVGIEKALSLPEGYAALPFTNPDAFLMAQEFAFSEHRKPEDRLKPEELLFRIVDVHGVRFYVVAYPAMKMMGILGVWQNPGTGTSTRLSEELLKYPDDIKPLSFEASGKDDVAVDKLPPATYLDEAEAHQKLRERIVGLLKRAPLDPATATFAPDDVYMYNSGMASIYRMQEVILKVRPGTVVALGSIFHNTYHLLAEAPRGLKHFGECDAKSGVMDKLEAYLASEAKEGRAVSFVLVEFPSNPILISVDLKRLKKLADEYGFYAVIDDTVGSFCNIDISSVADVIITSTTKSFSGYADILSGTMVLNPFSPRYAPLKAAQQAAFHNEFSQWDAEALLKNSNDYLERSAVLNRNAAAIAEAAAKFLAAHPDGPMTQVLYPPQSDTFANYQAMMRPVTEDFKPGYGCLLSLEFEDRDCTRAFYDNLGFYHGPHLGAHLSLAIPFNATTWWAEPKEGPYHESYGNRSTQIRLSAGLEDAQDLVETVNLALEKALEAKKEKSA